MNERPDTAAAADVGSAAERRAVELAADRALVERFLSDVFAAVEQVRASGMGGRRTKVTLVPVMLKTHTRMSTDVPVGCFYPAWRSCWQGGRWRKSAAASAPQGTAALLLGQQQCPEATGGVFPLEQ